MTNWHSILSTVSLFILKCDFAALLLPTYCSGVGNEVDLGNAILMLLVLLLIESLEMLRECFGHYGLYMRLAGLWATGKLKRLEVLLVGSLELKLLRLVVRDPQLACRDGTTWLP